MLNIGSKVYRNLPEQVAENVKQIAKLWQKLDGLDVYDNVLVLDSLDPLTPDELDLLARPVSFIVYNNNVYMKRGASASQLFFDKVYNVSETSGTVTFSTGEIVVDYPLGTLTLNSDSIDTYTTTKIDTLLSAKLDTSALLDNTFPVGAIFVSANNTSPAGTLGGTWQALNSGNACKLALSKLAEVYAGTTNHNSHLNNPLIMVDNSAVPISGNYGLQTLSNGGLSYKSTTDVGSAGVYYAHPANLYADLDDYVTVYMWQRTA